MTINQLLKYAGLYGLTIAFLFMVAMLARVAFGLPDFPEEIFAAFIGGGAIGFFSCLILVLNDIATTMKSR